jgi:hypothetical protein
MPIHVGDNKDKGGNLTQLRWFDRGSNMHRVWDSGIIDWASDTEDFWMAELAEPGAAENADLPSAGFDSLHGPSQPLRSPIARRSNRCVVGPKRASVDSASRDPDIGAREPGNRRFVGLSWLCQSEDESRPNPRESGACPAARSRVAWSA